MPRWLPVPCSRTSGGPEPWLSKAMGMARGSLSEAAEGARRRVAPRALRGV
jgi:hypothetical protein